MSQNQFEESIKFFADRQRDEIKRTALNVQYTRKEKSAEMTVNIEVTKLQGTEAQWADKMYLQLSKYEMTALCELLFGLRKSAVFNYHGVKKNKGLTVHNNGAQGIMLVMTESGLVLHHLLSHEQRIELGVFIIRRQAMAWQVAVSDVLAILRQSVAIGKLAGS